MGRVRNEYEAGNTTPTWTAALCGGCSSSSCPEGQHCEAFFCELGNVSRSIYPKGFFLPRSRELPVFRLPPEDRPTRPAAGRAQRSIDTHGTAETTTDAPLRRGCFTAPHGLVVQWQSVDGPSRQINSAHGALPLAQHTNVGSIATIPHRFGFGLGDVGRCRWARALDRVVPRVAGLPATLGYTAEHPLRGTSHFFAVRRGWRLDGLAGRCRWADLSCLFGAGTDRYVRQDERLRQTAIAKWRCPTTRTPAR